MRTRTHWACRQDSNTITQKNRYTYACQPLRVVHTHSVLRGQATSWTHSPGPYRQYEEKWAYWAAQSVLKAQEHNAAITVLSSIVVFTEQAAAYQWHPLLMRCSVGMLLDNLDEAAAAMLVDKDHHRGTLQISRAAAPDGELTKRVVEAVKHKASCIMSCPTMPPVHRVPPCTQLGMQSHIYAVPSEAISVHCDAQSGKEGVPHLPAVIPCTPGAKSSYPLGCG